MERFAARHLTADSRLTEERPRMRISACTTGLLIRSSPRGMVSHMKTTIQIPDSVLDEARRIARRDRTTLKVLVEQGLRRIIAERKRGEKFRLRRVTFRGEGLDPRLASASWDQIRDLSYEGRGG